MKYVKVESYVVEAGTDRPVVYCVLIMSTVCYQGWSGTLALVAASRHNTQPIYQLLFMQHLLKMSK
jgi:hypothetical protein